MQVLSALSPGLGALRCEPHNHKGDNMEKKVYTQKEKIAYYAMKVAKARSILEGLERQLERVMKDDYQDWNSELQKQLKAKKEA